MNGYENNGRTKRGNAAFSLHRMHVRRARSRVGTEELSTESQNGLQDLFGINAFPVSGSESRRTTFPSQLSQLPEPRRTTHDSRIRSRWKLSGSRAACSQ